MKISESKLEQIKGMNNEDLEIRRDDIDNIINELRSESGAISRELQERRGKEFEEKKKNDP